MRPYGQSLSGYAGAAVSSMHLPVYCPVADTDDNNKML
jgi:hypothetical protein